MTWGMGIALYVAACSAAGPAPTRQAPPARPKATVEFRWLEPEPVKDVTEDRKIQISCGDERWYPHRKPVLTSKDVAGTHVNKLDLSANGLQGDHFYVLFR